MLPYFRELDWDIRAITEELGAHAQSLGLTTSTITASFLPVDLKALLDSTPSLVEFLNYTNFTPERSFFFITDSDTQSPIHIDGNDCWPVGARINFPVLNCETSRTDFYKKRTQWLSKEMFNLHNLNYRVYSDPSPERAASLVLTKATVFNIQEPHQVVTDKTPGQRRISLTLQVRPDPIFLLKR